MTTVGIIQARMGSTRFPGKMLAHLGHYSILEWVFKRLSQAKTLDKIILATSSDKKDDALVERAAALGLKVYRGSEEDVLARFIGASKECDATNIVRVCADNPFIDPVEVDRLVRFFRENKCDYACNHQDRLGSGYADGFGAEIFSAKTLKLVHQIAKEQKYREHVTLYLWECHGKFELKALASPPELAFPYLRFDVDTPDDLLKLDTLVSAGVDINTSAIDIIKIAQNVSRGLDGSSEAIIAELDSYLRRLFPLCRSITGEPNRQTLRILRELIPLKIYEVPSGASVFDWTVPFEWNIRDAYIANSNGQRIIDFKVNNLHVVSYSTPINTRLSWSELSPHLYIHPSLPNAIPYRTSYYQESWGFCLTHAQYDALEKSEGPFEVVIDSSLEAGSLTYGEFYLPGVSKQEILISTYICHPSMANDSLSGVLLTAFLARKLMNIKNRHYSYRIIFVPETIGAIAYCAINEKAVKEIDVGLVITTVGGPGKFGYKQSYDFDHVVNKLVEEVFVERGIEFVRYPFDIHGSDERQYSSQGFRINAATITRDRYYEYPQYHTSCDDLSFVTARQIYETYLIYLALVDKLDKRLIYRNLKPNCEVMLSRHDLYPKNGGSQLPELRGRSELDLILWILFLSDGKVDVRTISEKLNVAETILIDIAETLVEKGILRRV